MTFPVHDGTAFDFTAVWDKTANTFGRSVDSQLWPALMRQSPILAMIPRFTVDHTVFEWESAQEPTRTYTEANSGSTTVDGSGSGTALVVTSSAGLEAGMLLKNASRATPIGTYGFDEVMLVTAVSSTTLTVQRDYTYCNSGTGSTAHALTDVFEVIGVAKEEGSVPNANKYKDVVLAQNYTQVMDFYLTVTGSQAASRRLLAADNLAAQTKMGVAKLANEMESLFLYGNSNPTTAAGSDSQVRTSKGFAHFITASATNNVDYSTRVVTQPALDSLFAEIIENNTDPMDKFIIVCHPERAREISHFGDEFIRISQSENEWGREIITFKSDLGIRAPIHWTLNCSKSDLFVINLNKVGIAEYRPWMQTEVVYSDDMVDAWRQRVLGEYGFKVVDGCYSHAAMSYLTW